MALLREYWLMRPMVLAQLAAVSLLLTGCTSSNFVYVPDSQLYGVNDLWTYPVEVDGRLYGDCEDYAIMRITEAGKGMIGLVDNGTHAVAVIDGKVYDVNYRNPRRTSDYPDMVHIQWPAPPENLVM